MNRLKLLVLGDKLKDSDKELVISSLQYFIKHWPKDLLEHEKCDRAEELRKTIEFEDLCARQTSGVLNQRGSEFGYILALGKDVIKKLEQTQDYNKCMVQCHTLEPSEWSGPLRERIITQLNNLIGSWLEMRVESELAKLAMDDNHPIEEVYANLDQFKRHVQLMIQNGRPHIVLFEKDQVILRDATKRLREPFDQVVPVVLEKKSLGARDEILKKLEQIGYPKVFLMEIDEFMLHIKLICTVGCNNRAHIVVESSDAPDNQR